MTGYLTDYKSRMWQLPVLLSWDVSHGMGAFDSTDNTFCAGQIFKGIDCFIIRNRNILGPAYFMKIGMFRSDSRIIETSRNRIYLIDLTLVILTKE